MKPSTSRIVGSLVLAVGTAFSAVAVDGASTCLLQPWDTVDNGMGAEPGVIREFATGLVIPPGCLSHGRVFLPFVEVTLTRTSSGPSVVPLEVFIRVADPITGEPTEITTPPNSVLAEGIPVFPSYATYEFPLLPTDVSLTEGVAYQNTLWGDYQYLSTTLSGDYQSVFVIADESGVPGATTCRTGINGAPPLDDCLNGNPNLNSAGHSATGYTFYSRYSDGGMVAGDNRVPLSSTWGARYVAGTPNRFGVVRNLRIRDGRGGPVICAYLGIPAEFEFDCVMSAGQQARHDNGDLFAEIEIDGVSEEVRIHPAGVLVFVDGFESGGAGVWSSTS